MSRQKKTTEGMIKRVMQNLIDNEYQTAPRLAKKCAMSASSIYHIIRIMRLRNIGVLTTNNGYVLAEYAKKKDDVNFMRRLWGRRVSDYISAKAAEPHIYLRWKGIEQKKDLRLMYKPLVNIETESLNILISKIDKKHKGNLLINLK